MTRQQKIGLVAPLVVLPFLTLLAWAAGVGKVRHPPKATPVAGINTAVPKPTLAPATHKTKLDYYNQSRMDSAERVIQHPADTIPPVAAHLQRSLARLQATIGVRPALAARPVPGATPALGGPEPGVHPQTEPLVGSGLPMEPSARPMEPIARPMEPRLHPMEPSARPVALPPVPLIRPQPPAPDPDLEKYDRLLDKIIAIEHPEAVKTKEIPIIPAPSAQDTLPAIQAQIEADASLVSGETIALRLEEGMHIQGEAVDSSTLLYGTVSLQGERLHIQIRSVMVGRKILAVHLEAYDQDGQIGVYVPGSLERDVAKESTEGSIGSLNLDVADPGLGSQAANAGLQAAKSLLSRKVRQVRVFIRAGYQVWIK